MEQRYNKTQIFSVWEGVFDSFEDAQATVQAFNSETWIEKQKIKCTAYLSELNGSHSYNYLASRRYPLSLVTALMLANTDQITVLDFGGGMATQYLEIIARIPQAQEKVTFIIIENESLINQLPSELKIFKNLFFYSDISLVKEKVDLLHIGSTLQYIQDWKGLLSNLLFNYCPQKVVFSDLLAGDIATFATHQIFYEHRIPMWFFSFSEIVAFFEENNFKCIFHEKYISKILDQEAIFPNFGLPEEFRIDRALNLVFEAK